jgi:hypothetical protein
MTRPRISQPVVSVAHAAHAVRAAITARAAIAAIALIALGSVAGTTARADEGDAPPLSIYGFARLDILADDSRMSDIAQPMYVLREPAGGHYDAELTMTPRLSRVGLGIDPWELSSGVTGEGKLEIDFSGGAGTNAIRLRHAYASLTFGRIVELLAGQTTDLISPLFPSAQNDTQLLFAGNTGDRRPQLQLAFAGDRLRGALGLATTGSLSRADADADGQLDGMASARPMLQWIVEYRQRLLGEVLRLGVWGHAASSELADGTEYGGASVGMHVYLPITRRVVWLGEAYLGHNLADIGGGIGQGYSPMTGTTIRGAGGWFEVAALPTRRHVLALGGSIDTARSSDLAPGDRERNHTVYGVLRYQPLASLQLGLEYLYWHTRYKDVGQGVANRVNLHLSVLF